MSETLERTEARTSAHSRAEAWLAEFGAALAAGDPAAVADLFGVESYWRDLVSFTWNIVTVEGRDGVRDLVARTASSVRPSGFVTSEPASDNDGVVTTWIRFETAVARGEGLLRLREEDGRDRAWTLLTAITELKGHEEPRRTRRPMGAAHGTSKDRTTWKERLEQEAEDLGTVTQPYVLVIGGGQGGVALGARMRQLGVPSLVVDRHDRPGDQWRGRYKSLSLHDPVWYDHLPYLKFPDNWPVFAPKDKIGDWLESYVRIMEIPYWSKTRVTSAEWSEAEDCWRVELNRDGQPLTLHPTELVFATGMSGKPNMPAVPGADVFSGETHHSSAHPGPDAYRGKKVVVIGSNNSAFDICGALWEHDAEVTMVQRSSTHIVKSASLMEYGLGDLYSERALEAGVTTEKADLTFASLPYRIMHQFQIPAYEKMAEVDKDFYDRLEAAGFWHDWGADGSGLFMKYLRRGSGYYIDVGSAELVADGEVALVRGQIDRFTENGIVLEDGRELPADLVVFATGYRSMNGWVADLIDQETADRLGKVWGLGSDTPKDPGPWEGEQRNMWKPTQVPHLWMHGGNLHQSRHYSLYLALQLKARHIGLDTPVYGLQEVHHVG